MLFGRRTGTLRLFINPVRVCYDVAYDIVELPRGKPRVVGLLFLAKLIVL